MKAVINDNSVEEKQPDYPYLIQNKNDESYIGLRLSYNKFVPLTETELGIKDDFLCDIHPGYWRVFKGSINLTND